MIKKKDAKKVISLYEKHISLVEETLRSMTETLRLYISGDYQRARDEAYQTHLKEGEADGVRRQIIEKMYTSSFLPMVREDLINYLAKEDKIADHAESTCDFLITQRPKVPDKFCKDIIKIAESSCRALDHLRGAIESFFTDFASINKHIKKVNTIEEETDTLEWHLTEKIYSSDLLLEEKIHLNSLIYHVGLIVDTVENAADMLDSMVVKKKV